MIILALDTATPVASVALSDGERIFELAESVTTYSERLLPIIDALFSEAKLAPRALQAVACSAGPGSFTGLRIGLSTAKGLCLATDAKLVLVPSLAALAGPAAPGAIVVSAIDAFRGEMYAGVFAIDADGVPQPVRPALAAFSVHPDALAAALEGLAPQHYVGDGFAKYPAAIPDGASALVSVACNARSVLALAQRRLSAGDSDDPRLAAPLYVRASAPEEALR